MNNILTYTFSATAALVLCTGCYVTTKNHD